MKTKDVTGRTWAATQQFSVVWGRTGRASAARSALVPPLVIRPSTPSEILCWIRPIKKRPLHSGSLRLEESRWLELPLLCRAVISTLVPAPKPADHIRHHPHKTFPIVTLDQRKKKSPNSLIEKPLTHEYRVSAGCLAPCFVPMKCRESPKLEAESHDTRPTRVERDLSRL